MDRMLVVVFDTETKAYEGKKTLLQLDNEGSIAVYGYAVVGKNADGTTTVKQSDDPGPLGTLVGTSLGSLIGLLGGPAGLAIGAAAGLVAGSTVDLDNARIGDDFIDDVTQETDAEQIRGCRGNSRRLDDAGGHPHGSNRRHCFPAGSLKCEGDGR